MAVAKAGQVEADLQKTANEIRNLTQDWDIKTQQIAQGKITTAQMERLSPIIIKIQELDMRARQAGLAGLENVENFEKAVGVSAPVVRFFLEMLRGTRGYGH